MMVVNNPLKISMKQIQTWLVRNLLHGMLHESNSNIPNPSSASTPSVTQLLDPSHIQTNLSSEQMLILELFASTSLPGCLAFRPCSDTIFAHILSGKDNSKISPESSQGAMILSDYRWHEHSWHLPFGAPTCTEPLLRSANSEGVVPDVLTCWTQSHGALDWFIDWGDF